MNLLAHFYLSRQSPSLMVGSFLGDFVKGKQFQKFSQPLVDGILLHREIDSFTDQHPIFLKSKHRLVPQHGHYSGVIVDIFYDHFLATNWSQYTTVSLKDFAQRVYKSLYHQQSCLPASARQVLSYMSQHDWLSNYSRMQAIGRTLEGMQKRSRFPNTMGKATQDLQHHYRAFEQEFTDFFPEIEAHCQQWLHEHQVKAD